MTRRQNSVNAVKTTIHSRSSGKALVLDTQDIQYTLIDYLKPLYQCVIISLRLKCLLRTWQQRQEFMLPSFNVSANFWYFSCLAWENRSRLMAITILLGSSAPILQSMLCYMACFLYIDSMILQLFGALHYIIVCQLVGICLLIAHMHSLSIVYLIRYRVDSFMTSELVCKVWSIVWFQRHAFFSKPIIIIL